MQNRSILVLALVTFLPVAGASMPVAEFTTESSTFTVDVTVAGHAASVTSPVAAPVVTSTATPLAPTLGWWGDRGIGASHDAAAAFESAPTRFAPGPDAEAADNGAWAILLPDASLALSRNSGDAETTAASLWFSNPLLTAAGLEPDEPWLAATRAIAAVDALAARAVGAETERFDFAQQAPTFDGPAAPAPRTTTAAPAPTTTAAPDVATASQATAAATDADAFATARVVAAATALVALPALIGWALYSRIRAHAALDNATRRRVFEAVEARSGATVPHVAAAAGVAYSTASYHLDRLQKVGLVVCTPHGGRLLYFKAGGAIDDTARRVLPVLTSAEALRVLDAIRAQPGTYRAAIAEALGVSAATVNWHLKRLAAAGLVREAREGRRATLGVDSERFSALVAKVTPHLEATGEQAAAARLLDRVAVPGTAHAAAAVPA